MILSNGAFLKSTRLNAIVRDQSENYQRRLPLRFLDRTAIVDADDEEITGSYTGKVLAADVIADDQPALVYDTGAFEFVTNVIPNLKIGQRITQSKLNMLERMERGNIDRDEVGVFEGWQATVAANLRRGVEERMNALICAMMLDNVTYDRFGVKLAVNWGTPSGYKVTPSVLWTTAATATPITDILALKEFAEIDSGQNFDRVTMAKATFRLMTATTEFKNLIIGLVGQPITAATAYNTYDQRLEGFASQLLGMDIEFEDKVYHEQSARSLLITQRSWRGAIPVVCSGAT